MKLLNGTKFPLMTNPGSMTNIGGGEGLLDAPLGKMKGRFAWLAWRS